MKVLRGQIGQFSAVRGDGIFVSDAGREMYFHALEIADGSRHISEGVTVEVVRRVGLRGRDEASQIVVVATRSTAH